MGMFIATLLAFVIFNRVKAQTLSWDDNAHTSFTLTIDHNLSQSIVVNQITYNQDTYELMNPIVINESSSSITTIETYMSFEEPIDDIKQADTNFTNYRASLYDFQSISSAKAASLLELVHNGTLEYRDRSYYHLLIDGTGQEVQMKNYPITASCPGSCKNPSEQGFGYTYGGSASCDSTCIVYLCEYLGVNWGAGSCNPLGVDNNTTSIESQHEAWWAILEGDSVSYRIVLAWGLYDPPSANQIYPNRWGLQYVTGGGTDIDKECSSATVYWDNGYFAGDLYKPIADLGNEYRVVSYSMKNMSVVSEPSISITIGSYSDTFTPSNGNAIKQAISEKLAYQKIIMNDIGFVWDTAGSLSDSSTWLFVNNTYFGFACDQIMVDQLTWEAATCGTCMDHVLSTWSTTDHGIATIPYYDDLDTSNGIQNAVKVMTNLAKYSEENMVINFNYAFPTSSISISSTNFAFKTPNACNAVSQLYISTSTKSTNVSFNNCGTISADFTYTINCANGYTSTTPSSVTIVVNGVQSDWTQSVTNANCISVSSITIATSSCPEFWDITCTWTTTMTTITPEPTPLPTPLPTLYPTPLPTAYPTLSPTPFPTQNPTLSPTAAPVSFFDSCTSYQVVPVRGAVQNAIIHQELCLPSVHSQYIIDINAKKPYYITVDSTSVSNTTINKINEADYDTGADSGTAATGSALTGHSMIVIETWYDVLAYLGLDLSEYSTSQSIYTSIKIDDLTISADLSSTYLENLFTTNLKSKIVIALELTDSDQITIFNLRSGSIIADITISSSGTSNQSPLQISKALQNYIASNEASSASITSPLNSINNYFYDNQTNDIVFTNCPYRITETAWEGKTVTVSWDEPTVKTSLNFANINVFQAIGEESGESFATGSYFVRYVALSVTNSSITPTYCSFAIVVDEREWVLEFMGIEFSITTLIIIATVLFCICAGSIACSTRIRCKKRKQAVNHTNNIAEKEGNFKPVLISPVNAIDAKIPKLKITRSTAPLLDE